MSAPHAYAHERVGRFEVGQPVRVAAIFPPGHVRTPHYCRGKVGSVVRICGAFRNPEELAYGRRDGEPVPLYRVRFDQRELWPGYDGAAGDHVEIEIYEHWLEAEPPAPRQGSEV